MECIKQYRVNQQYFLVVYLFPVFALLWFTYPVSGITGINYQLIETILHSGFVYYLMFLKIKEPPADRENYKFTGINEKDSRDHFEKLEELITKNEYYLDPDINLDKLSRKAHLTVNALSQVINQNSGLSFRDFINTFRIEKAKKDIHDYLARGMNISSLAYDCGFNSMSAFNRAFKNTRI
jgi:AraC-like DNA-binding protein